MQLLDIETLDYLQLFEGHMDWILSVAWRSDERRVLTGSNDRTVRLWNVDTGRCLQVLEGHRDQVTSVVFNADQRHALSGSTDMTVRLWDLDTGRCVRSSRGATGSAFGEWRGALINDGLSLATKAVAFESGTYRNLSPGHRWHPRLTKCNTRMPRS